MTTNDYSSIKGISFKFMRHSAYQYREVHSTLNRHYGEDIYDIDDLFTKDRTAIPSGVDINAKVTALIMSSMRDNGADADKLSTLFTDGLFLLKWHQYATDNHTRIGNQNFGHVLDDAINAKANVLRVSINVNLVHFKEDFSVTNLDDFSKDPFETAPRTPTNRMSSIPANTPESLEQVIRTALFNMVSPAGAAQSPADTPVQPGGAQTQQTGNIVNPASLPAVVQERLDKAKRADYFMTKSDRDPFQLPMSSTVVQSNHFSSRIGSDLITRSGDLWYFSQHDSKQEKNFISRVPKLSSKTCDKDTIREWYYQFHEHAKSYGIYVHNYFDFRSSTGDDRGFTCGASTTDDLPQWIDDRLRLWSSLIYTAISSIFPSGTEPYRTIASRHGRGYDALFEIIRHDHPEHTMYKALLIRDRPRQAKSQTISEFYIQYANYLRLHSYLDNRSTTLNKASEKELFIGSLIRGTELLNSTYDERSSLDPYKIEMYKQGNLVATLEKAKARLPPLPHTSPPLPQRPSGSQPRLRPHDRRQTRSRSDRSASTPTKAANVVLCEVNNVQITDADYNVDDPYSIAVPDGLEHYNALTDKYINAVRTGQPFDTTRPCLACNTAGHTFDDCPVLKNIEFLRKHYLAHCHFNKRNTYKAEEHSGTQQSVNQVRFEDNKYSHADPSHTQYCDETSNDEEDFHRGRE